jgi:hypothetical protein
MQIMNPAHPRWNEFVDRLGGPEACGWTEDDTWRCSGGHAYARAIIEDMGVLDVDASIAFFEEHGASCDCEILINVDLDPDDDPEGLPVPKAA